MQIRQADKMHANINLQYIKVPIPTRTKQNGSDQAKVLTTIKTLG